MMGDNLRKARKLRHWTQKTMATKMGVSAATLSALEGGQLTVTLEILGRALSALDMETHLSEVAARHKDKEAYLSLAK